MTGEDNGQPIPYKLDMSGAVTLKINDLIHNPAHQAMRPKIIRALKIIFARLRGAPLDFGEIFRRLKSLNLLLHAAVVHPVGINFAIQPEKRFVILQRVFLVK
jgi:hypothetical protein